MGKDNARDQAYLYAERKYKATAKEEVAARYFGTVAAELGLGNIVGDNTINRIAAKVGIDGKSRNLSRRILSAVAKYNRVQNAKSKKSQTDTKKKNASGKLFYKLKEYTQKQRDNWKDSKRIVIYESEAQFREFIEESVENKQYDKKMYFGAVSPELASLIKEKTGVEVEGYNCSLSSYEIRKILKDHGNEETERPRGQRAITPDDFLNMPEVIQSPDNISLSPTKYEGKDAVMFEGQFDTGKMTVVAVVSDKHLDLFIQTAYVGVKKGNLATPIDEQASINTPEASRGTVSNKTISQPESKVNTKTSNSQTSEKKSDTKTAPKSKGKTADDVYEKGRKLKVGDKVGEVKLVADESGKPITPVLRASFDRTDVPSYILATIEATGDTALISALEDEIALMMLAEKASVQSEFPLHDAVEELSEHVRDGDITPEQAAHILSEENAHPSGADIDTLIDQEKLSGMKYSVGYTTNNNPVAIIEEDFLDGISEDKWIDTVKETISEKFSSGIPISGRLVKVNRTTRREFTGSKNTQHYKSKDGTIYEDKMKSANNLDDIMLASTNYINEDLNHKRKDNFVQFARGDVLLRIGNNDYSAKVIVGYTSGNHMVLYDVVDFVKTSINVKKVDMRSPSNSTSAKNSSNISTNNTISQSDPVVNSQYMQKSENNTESDENSLGKYRYSIALPDVDNTPAVDFKARAENIVALANSLQDGVQNDAEYAALERDVEKLKVVREEIRTLNESIDTNESGLKASRVSDTIRNMISRSICRQGDEIQGRLAALDDIHDCVVMIC